MKKKITAIIITLCMVFAIMPITALAANETVLDISQGNITITNDGVNINGVATYASNENGYIITGTTTQYNVTVTAEKANITLSDLSINLAYQTNINAFSIAKGSAVELTLSGTNTLTGSESYAGLWVPVGAAVTIQSATGDSTDSLTARGGDWGAGIGGNDGDETSPEEADCGEITINSGKVEAIGGRKAAGIGSGLGGNGGIVTISAVSDNSTVVIATGREGGAGIGGGSNYGVGGGSGKTIIKGGTVTATAYNYGAGIGAGGNGIGGDGVDVTIDGGIVTATGGGGDNPGIGGERVDVTINGGSVTATGYGRAAGIGADGAYPCGDIEITGGTVVATAGGDTAAIGTNRVNNHADGDITITGGKVTANGSENYYGIATVNNRSISISNATVIAKGGLGAIRINPTLSYSVGYQWRTLDTGMFDSSSPYTWSEDHTYFEIEIPLLGISLDPTATVNVGETEKLAVTFDPYCASDKTIVWTSSNEDVATVDENGVVTAISEGVTTITATAADGTTVTCVVTVTVPVTGIILALNLTVGDTATLTATVAPENVTDNTITWTSSDESVATVDENGKITATGVGEATITATANGMTATFAVTVAVPAVPVTGIELSPPIALAVNDTEKLSVTFTPENAGDKSLTWTSSNESVATVDENGQVVAISVGTATIIATTSNGKTATCEVTVIVPVTGIELASTLALNVGETDTLTATIAPENATIKTITWTSSDETVATVDKYGQVTAIGAGEATITATTINGKTATCAVTVAEGEAAVEVASVTLDKATIDLTVGDSDTLTATIAPENAADKTVTWTSSDTSVATVDENGKITAIGAGEATITATANGISATCTVSVEAAAEPTPEPEEPEETNAFLAFLRRIKSFFENIFRSLGLMK